MTIDISYYYERIIATKSPYCALIQRTKIIPPMRKINNKKNQLMHLASYPPFAYFVSYFRLEFVV